MEQAKPPVSGPGIPGPEAEADSTELNIEGDDDLLREFLDESYDHLQKIELEILALENQAGNPDSIHSIFRAFHTLKGGSAWLHLAPLNRLAHELESLLDLARQQKLTVDSRIINLILDGCDTIRQFLERIESQLSGNEPPAPIRAPFQALIDRIRAVKQAPAPESPGPKTGPGNGKATGAPGGLRRSTDRLAQEPPPAAPTPRAAHGDNRAAAGLIKIDG
ncbi:MAG: Hpt domain-containing protein, partial [Candidatus Omnitrophica bacterium]|nr:Hpt domain-containing protein [Candidatus Omnitrophota bacterium]